MLHRRSRACEKKYWTLTSLFGDVAHIWQTANACSLAPICRLLQYRCYIRSFLLRDSCGDLKAIDLIKIVIRSNILAHGHASLFQVWQTTPQCCLTFLFLTNVHTSLSRNFLTQVLLPYISEIWTTSGLRLNICSDWGNRSCSWIIGNHVMYTRYFKK